MTATALETGPRPGAPAMTAAAAPPRPLRRSPVPVREPRAASRVIRTDDDLTDLDPPGTLTLPLPIDLPPEVAEAVERAARRRPRRDRTGRSRIGGATDALDDVLDDKTPPTDEQTGCPDAGRGTWSDGEGTWSAPGWTWPAGDRETPPAGGEGTPPAGGGGTWPASGGASRSGRNVPTVRGRRPAAVRLESGAMEPPARQAVGGAGVHGELLPDGADESRSALTAVPDGGPDLPEAKIWAGTFLQAAMEVATGIRSPAQLVRWTTPDVHGLLVRRGSLATRVRRSGTSDTKPRIRALLSCVPRDGICEVGAVVAETERIRAVAFRMEGLHGRWRVTELVIG